MKAGDVEAFCVLGKEEKQLIASERKDEANLVKVKNNIYGVCKTIYEAVGKNTKPEELNEKYSPKNQTYQIA